MKESNEWVRQPMVDKAGDELMAQRGCDLSQITPYAVAKHLGCEPNGQLYKKVYDWRKRHLRQSCAGPIEIPPAQAAEFRGAIDRFTADIYDQFTRVVGVIAGELDRTASQRVSDAEKHQSEAEAETAEVLELCADAEAKLAEAQAQIRAMSASLDEAQRREDRLLGRLEQLHASSAARGAITENVDSDRGGGDKPAVVKKKRSYVRRAQPELPLDETTRGPL